MMLYGKSVLSWTPLFLTRAQTIAVLKSSQSSTRTFRHCMHFTKDWKLLHWRETANFGKANGLQVYELGCLLFFFRLQVWIYDITYVTCFPSYFTTLAPCREQGWRSGESTRFPPVRPGLESWCRCRMWVKFVVSSLPSSEKFFSWYSGFPLPNYNSIWNARIRFSEFF